MPEETKKKLQEIIDHDFELAKKSAKEFEEEKGIKVDVEKRFCFFVCWDLQNQFGLDLKGVIPY